MKYKVGNATKYDIIKGYAKNKDTFFLEKFDPIMEKYENLPLKPKYIKKIIYIVSSNCTCTPEFVSTQDKLTMGYRRLAVSGLEKLLVDNYGVTIDDIIKTDYEKAIEISNDPKWIEIQFADHMQSFEKSLKKHNYKLGREIALYERIKNSAPAWLQPIPKDYDELKQIYINKKGKKGEERVKEIEKLVLPFEIWR